MNHVSRSAIASSSRWLPFLPRSRLTSYFSRRAHHALANVASKTATQTYISTSLNPYINLSIEHYLLTTCHPSSSVLFLYINSPCVVIGRNQNPWNEVNLRALQTQPVISDLAGEDDKDRNHTSSPGRQHVELVRRRSGGGTVFHDAGNLNYCAITPRAVFNRDRSAMMVARALESLREGGMKLAGQDIRVNERHDIVMDLATPNAGTDVHDSTVKVSGSAYKLTSGRALHHGTLLLSSPNLTSIGQYLRSPARPYIKAKGVDSVRSPIGNVLKPPVEDLAATVDHVKEVITKKFIAMTDPQQTPLREAVMMGGHVLLLGDEVIEGNDPIAGKIKAGTEELKVGVTNLSCPLNIGSRMKQSAYCGSNQSP